VRVSLVTQLSVVIMVKFTTQFSDKLSHPLSQQLNISEFELPFWVVSVLR